MSSSAKDHHPFSFKKLLIVSCVCFFAAALVFVVYDATIGGSLAGKGYGPGAYYYTDVPGWNHIFLESPFLGFDHPLWCIGFFAGWGLVAYKALIWLNDKL